MVRHDSGGILGALLVLKDHWGPVGRDLAASGWAWTDVGERLPWQQFVEFVVYSPPTSAVYTIVNEGWTPDTHRLTDLVDIGALLLWSKTKEAQEDRGRPDPLPRPGTENAEAAPVMTIGDYMKLSGMEN